MQEKFGDIIKLIAQDRNINENIVLDVLKKILLDYAESQYGNREHLKINFNQFGGCEIFIEREIVENDSKSFLTISLESAQNRNPKLKIGDSIKEILPFNLDNTKKIELIKELQSQLKKFQKQKEYETFYEKIGTILIGCVKNVDASEAIISFTDHIGEVGLGSLKISKTIKSDSIKYNNYIKVYIEDINKYTDPQIILSRTHPNFLRELLKNEIPEISENLIEIKAIARDPGSLSKVAIHSNRLSINPIKICIGDRGSRIHNIIKELSGEKISFVLWNENIHQFIANALSPANILKVIETKEGRYDIVVPDEDMSKALGRGAQNVQLARKLCNIKLINILTEKEYKELIEAQTKYLIDNLMIEEMMAHLLISENFETIESIANANEKEITNINGFTPEITNILINRAKTFLAQEEEKIKNENSQHGKMSLFEIEQLSIDQIKILLKNDISSIIDLAQKDSDQLTKIFDKEGIKIDNELNKNIILLARGKLYQYKKENKLH